MSHTHSHTQTLSLFVAQYCFRVRERESRRESERKRERESEHVFVFVSACEWCSHVCVYTHQLHLLNCFFLDGEEEGAKSDSTEARVLIEMQQPSHYSYQRCMLLLHLLQHSN